MADSYPTGKDSSMAVARRPSRVTMVLAAIGVIGILALGSVILEKLGVIEFSFLDSFTETDEAPIRVRNGSMDLFLLSTTQTWAQVGGSDNWRVAGATRFKDDFEVTVAVKAGATCGGSVTGTGSDVVITYDNDKQVRLQSQNKNTRVKPGQGVTMTWDANTPQKLSYVPTGGFIKSIAVGNGANPTTMCTFSAANQLDHILILNVP